MPKTEFVWVELECHIAFESIKSVRLRPTSKDPAKAMGPFNVPKSQIGLVEYADEKADGKKPSRRLRGRAQILRLQMAYLAARDQGLLDESMPTD